MPELSRCKTCQQGILFCRTTGGHLLVLDAQSTTEGNVAIKDGIAFLVENSIFEEIIEGPYYTQHQCKPTG